MENSLKLNRAMFTWTLKPQLSFIFPVYNNNNYDYALFKIKKSNASFSSMEVQNKGLQIAE